MKVYRLTKSLKARRTYVLNLISALLFSAAIFLALQQTSRSLSMHDDTTKYDEAQGIKELDNQRYMHGTYPMTTTDDTINNSNKSTTITTIPSSSYYNGHRRAIFIISMGKEAAKTKIVERFIYSARTIGQYTGWIILLTDAPKQRYDNKNMFNTTTTSNTDCFINNDDNNFIVMNPLPIHYNTKFKHRDMTFKRFKTYVLDYIAMNEKLKHVELVYYLDVDIIFANPIQKLFDELETKYEINNNVDSQYTNNTKPQKSVMWMFKGNAKRVQVQGGQMILSLHKSRGCLERWRYKIDNNAKNRKDQFPLMEMWKEQHRRHKKKRQRNETHVECKIIRMEQENYISFPDKQQWELRVNEILMHTANNGNNYYQDDNIVHEQPYATLVHIRNTASVTSDVNETSHEIYLRDILRMTRNQEDVLGITQRMLLKAAKSDMELNPIEK